MPFRLPPEGTLTGLTLRVRDGRTALAFYRDLLGLHGDAGADGRLVLRPEARACTLELLVEPQAPPRPPRTVGLYHFALLLPDRRGLAAVVRRLLAAGWPLDGASDHGVSEALYLRDPEGNGIELYRDRPREDWPRGREGLAMVTDPLDITDLLSAAPEGGPLPAAARVGHMHLSISDLRAGEAFYAGALGLTVTQRSYPGALFLAAGDYHHHVGLNTWGGGRPAPPGAAGLVAFAWRIPAVALTALEAHLAAQGVPPHRDGSGRNARLRLHDPFGIEVTIAA